MKVMFYCLQMKLFHGIKNPFHELHNILSDPTFFGSTKDHSHRCFGRNPDSWAIQCLRLAPVRSDTETRSFAANTKREEIKELVVFN